MEEREEMRERVTDRERNGRERKIER